MRDLTAVLCMGCHFIYNNGGRAFSIHFVCGETRRPARNCFAKPVLIGRDATAAIVVNEMRETAVDLAATATSLATENTGTVLTPSQLSNIAGHDELFVDSTYNQCERFTQSVDNISSDTRRCSGHFLRHAQLVTVFL